MDSPKPLPPLLSAPPPPRWLPPIATMTQAVIPHEPANSPPISSQTNTATSSAAKELIARVTEIPLRDVELTLAQRQRKGHPDCSMLAYLRDPGDGVTPAQAATTVLEELADGIEDVSTLTAFVVRYIQAHRLWQSHSNPAINSLESFLGTVDGIQYVQAATVIGTSAQLMRARFLRLIEQHWGPQWYDQIPTHMRDPNWSRASDCSHQLLRLIAANAKQGLTAEQARVGWAASMAERCNEQLRQERKMRCSRQPWIQPDDVRSMNHITKPELRGRRTTEVFYPDEPAEDELKVELVRPRMGQTLLPAIRSTKDRKRKRSPAPAAATSAVDDDGWYRSKNGRWMIKQVGKHLIRKPIDTVSDDDVPDDDVDRLLQGTPESTVASPQIEELLPSTPQSGNQAPSSICQGPALAAALRRAVRSLTDSAFSTSSVAALDLVPRCCGSCEPDASMVHGLVRDAIRVARGLEVIQSHRLGGIQVSSSNPEGSNPPTPRFPRFRPPLPLSASEDN